MDIFYYNCLKDKRLEKRAQTIMDSMRENKTAIIHQTSDDLAEQIGAYRFFGNDNISLSDLF